jgi:hypothetical protein
MATSSIPGWCPETPVMESTHVTKENFTIPCEEYEGDNLSMDEIIDLGLLAVQRGYRQSKNEEIVDSLDDIIKYALDTTNILGWEDFFETDQQYYERLCDMNDQEEMLCREDFLWSDSDSDDE